MRVILHKVFDFSEKFRRQDAFGILLMATSVNIIDNQRFIKLISLNAGKRTPLRRVKSQALP
jgi:hypothetical protein